MILPGSVPVPGQVSQKLKDAYELQAPALELVKRVLGDLQRLDASSSCLLAEQTGLKHLLSSFKRTTRSRQAWDLCHLSSANATPSSPKLSACLSIICALQVPIHTVTLDVQDHDKTQQLPAQLPRDFQEVRMAHQTSCCICQLMPACLLVPESFLHTGGYPFKQCWVSSWNRQGA